MKLINSNYSYNTNHFQGENGTWKLIGTDGTSRFAKDALDEFKNIETNERIITERHKIYSLQQQGKIKAIINK